MNGDGGAASHDYAEARGDLAGDDSDLRSGGIPAAGVKQALGECLRAGDIAAGAYAGDTESAGCVGGCGGDDRAGGYGQRGEAPGGGGQGGTDEDASAGDGAVQIVGYGAGYASVNGGGVEREGCQDGEREGWRNDPVVARKLRGADLSRGKWLLPFIDVMPLAAE